jgi:hypothetical protein
MTSYLIRMKSEFSTTKLSTFLAGWFSSWNFHGKLLSGFETRQRKENSFPTHGMGKPKIPCYQPIRTIENVFLIFRAQILAIADGYWYKTNQKMSALYLCGILRYRHDKVPKNDYFTVRSTYDEKFNFDFLPFGLQCTLGSVIIRNSEGTSIIHLISIRWTLRCASGATQH